LAIVERGDAGEQDFRKGGHVRTTRCFCRTPLIRVNFPGVKTKSGGAGLSKKGFGRKGD